MDSNPARPQGPRTTQKYTSYSVIETTTPAAKIREYVTPDGVIFAVAWTGRAHPNLSLLLGKHFQHYQSATSTQPRKAGHRSHYKVTTDTNVVVEHSGHQRNLKGRAYDPALKPDGVTLDEIK